MTKILDKHINLSGLDVSCYQINQWFITHLGAKAVSEGKTLHHMQKDGFLDITKEEFIKLISEDLNLAFVSDKESYTYTTEEIVLNIDSDNYDADAKCNVYLVTTNEAVLDKFEEEAKEHIKKTKANTVFALVSGSEGFYMSSVGKVDAPLIRDNYPDNVVNEFDYVVDDFHAEDPHGRLVILNGEPGTGKTYWVKGLISSLKNVTVIIIPPSMITQIDGPSLLPTFIDHRRKKNSSIVLILEDADSCLAPREADNMSAISSLLNCADGILGSMLDIRIIATTNQKIEAFDPALTRPGRLTSKIKIGALNAEEATKVYRRLTEDEEFEYKESKTLAEVYTEADTNTGGKVKGSKKKTEPRDFSFNKRQRTIGF